MEHKIYYESENDALRIQIIGAFSYDDAARILPMLKSEIAAGHTRMVADIAQSPKLTMDRETRRFMQEKGSEITFDKMAFVGASPITRIICKVIMSVLGRSRDTAFFNRCDDAIEWLNGKK